MLTSKEVQQLGRELVQKEVDLKNVEMMDAIRDMLDGNWQLENPPPWWRDQPSSDPFDAWKDAVDLFSPLIPKLKMTPYTGKEDDRVKADKIEQALMWQAKRLANRGGDPHKEIVEDAFAFGRVGAQLIYLPYYKEEMKIFGGDEKRQKLAMRYGDFALIRKDPRTIFPYWTDFMLEGVMTVNLQPAQAVIDFWGPKIAKPIIEKMTKNEKLRWVTVYDYWSLDQRCIHVKMTETNVTDPYEVGGELLFNEKNEIPFLPWIVQDLGNPLRPLLYPIYKFDYWHSLNIIESAAISEVIEYIGYPRNLVKNGELDIEYGEVGTTAKLTGPLAEYQPMPAPGMDPGLLQALDRLSARASKSTISHTVQTGDFGAGTPYSSIRELIDLQTRRLNNGKTIVEKFWVETYKQMLYWSDFTGKPLNAYGERVEGGHIKIIAPKNIETAKDVSFDPENLFFEVEMIADIPQNEVERLNAGRMYREIGGSVRKTLERIGETDPMQVIAERRKEELEEADHQLNIEIMKAKRMRDFQMESQIMANQMAQQMSGQGQGQPGAGPGAGPGGMPMAPEGMVPGADGGMGGLPPSGAMGQPESGMIPPEMLQQLAQSGQGFENLGGPGFNPAEGGTPPMRGDANGGRVTQNTRNRG